MAVEIIEQRGNKITVAALDNDTLPTTVPGSGGASPDPGSFAIVHPEEDLGTLAPTYKTWSNGRWRLA